MNPYASHLGKRDPLEVIGQTSRQLQSLVETIGSERVEQRPAPAKWSAQEIVCHLADCEIVFAFRLRQALADDHHVIQPFDQEKWAAQYAAFDAAGALAVFAAVRNWNLSLIRSVVPGALSRTLNHPERGDMTYQVLIETMAGHDLNHIRQIEAIAGRSAQAHAGK
ncbi:MAG TPA: DinB family protein [Bryobacteraceae bacterium]|nr:DinB family protein [Bryobacteraceae bacterium]